MKVRVEVKEFETFQSPGKFELIFSREVAEDITRQLAEQCIQGSTPKEPPDLATKAEAFSRLREPTVAESRDRVDPPTCEGCCYYGNEWEGEGTCHWKPRREIVKDSGPKLDYWCRHHPFFTDQHSGKKKE